MTSAVARARARIAEKQGVATPESAEIIHHPASNVGGYENVRERRRDEGKIAVPPDVLEETANTVQAEAQKETAQTLSEVVARFNAGHFVSTEGGRAFVYRESHDHELGRARLDRMNVDAFKQLHGHEAIRVTDSNGNTRQVSVAEVWFRHSSRRTYPDGIALLPGGNAPAGVYNLWRGYGCEPKQGVTLQDVKPVVVHLLKVVCSDDKKAFDYLIKWLAYGVQNPGKQAEVAIVLQGGRGSGKGTVGRWFRDLYGMHGMHIQHPRHLTGNFNAHLQSCCAMFVDEAFFAGDRAGDAVLKSLITEDQVAIEKKGVDVASVRNRLKIIMATNSDHAVIAGTDERRYFVLRVSSVKAQDHSYFSMLDAWWNNGGKEAFLGYLLEYDLAGFNIRAVPNTAALEHQKIESLDVYNRWIFDKLSDGRWEQDRTPEQWAADFKLYAEERGGTRFINTSANSVGVRLRAAGIEVEKVRQSSGDRKNVWRVPCLSEARESFAAKLGLTYHRWEEDVEDVGGA